MGLFGNKNKVNDGLQKTRTGFWGNILNAFTGSKIDDDLYDELEEQLILADVGADVAVSLVDTLRKRVMTGHLRTGEQARDELKDIIREELTPQFLMDLSGKPAVILVIGVNGVGKTTSIAKMANYYKKQGRKVMLAAGDTFRAAATEQLEIWANQSLAEQGETVTARAVRTRMYFDTREYETFALPAGYYDAVRIILGEGAGQNWWCVLFPPLCSGACEEEFSQIASQHGMTPGEISFVTRDGTRYVLRFKAAELLWEFVHSALEF